MYKYLGMSPPPLKKIKSSEERIATQRVYEQSKRARSFQPLWGKEYPWLKHDETKGHMTCVVCMKYETSGSFVTGCPNIRLEAIKRHAASVSHQQNVLKDRPQHESSNEANKSVALLNKAIFDKLKLLVRNAHYIAKIGRPYTDYKALCLLDKAKGLDIGNTYLTDKYCQYFVATIAEVCRRGQDQTINEASFLSLISDGSTDTSSQEAEVLYARCALNGEVNTFFIGLRNVPRADSTHISGAISSMMEGRFGTRWSRNMIAMGTDGASVMLGNKSGVVQKIRELTKRPFIFAIHCSAHRLELAYKDAIKGVGIHEKCELLLKNMYLFYKYSPLNRSNLNAAFVTLGQKMLVPTRTGGTRWLPHTKKALNNLLVGYDAICLHLEQMQAPDTVKKDSSAKARNFLKLLKDQHVVYWLHFIMDVVRCLSKVSECIQYRNSAVSSVYLELESAKNILQSYTESDGPYLRKVSSSDNPTLPVATKQRVLQSLTEALSTRFDCDMKLFSGSSVLSFDQWPEDLKEHEDFGDKQIQELSEIARPALEACDSVTVDVEAIEAEWIRLKTSLYNSKCTIRDVTWKSIHHRDHGENYGNLFALVDFMLTLPASSVEAERGFSSMKLVKTDWRSRLGDRNLSDLMLVKLESEPVTTFNPTESVTLWHTSGKRIKRPQYMDDLHNCRSNLSHLDSPLDCEEAEAGTLEDDQDCVEAEDEMTKTLKAVNDEQTDCYTSLMQFM